MFANYHGHNLNLNKRDKAEELFKIIVQMETDKYVQILTTVKLKTPIIRFCVLFTVIVRMSSSSLQADLKQSLNISMRVCSSESVLTREQAHQRKFV